MLMHQEHVRRVPILDGSGSVIGIVTLDDLLALKAMKCQIWQNSRRKLSASIVHSQAEAHWWAAHA
jgi:CBS-domain-containing membrane protein